MTIIVYHILSGIASTKSKFLYTLVDKFPISPADKPELAE